MRILFVIPSLAKGGQEKAGMILCNYLMQYHSVTAVCLYPASDDEYPYKCPIIRITEPQGFGIWGKIKVMYKRITELKSIKKKLQPDVSIAFGSTAIILNQFANGGETKIASIRQSFKYRQSTNGIGDKLYRSILNYAFKKADKIVPVNKRINDELREFLNIKNDLFVTNGYLLDDIERQSNEPIQPELLPFFKDKAPVLAHLGRFDVSKCHSDLVKSFVLAKKQMPSIKLMLLGSTDTSKPVNTAIYNFCIQHLQNNGCKIIFAGKDYAANEIESADVLILGHQVNPFKYLSKANLFLFPSAWEGFPNALVEAMACGLPVISADCATGPREILEDEISKENFGILLPVFAPLFSENPDVLNVNHELWATTITALLSDEQKLEEFRTLSYKRAGQYDANVVCKKWLNIIEVK